MPGNPVIAPTEGRDKRGEERFTCRSPVELAYFNNAESYSGLMRNFSLTGASFECPQELVHGATVVMRLEGYQVECRADCTDRVECPWPRYVVLGEVKWCRGISGSSIPRFGVGVKFHLPQ
ncbi:MAG: PilZ domain-containing protein [Hyphomicrobiales bacterium]